VKTYELTGSRKGRYRVRVDTGDAAFDVDRDVNPVEHLLGSLVGCLGFTATTVAHEMDIDIEEFEATVEGDIDYGRYTGDTTDVRAGLQDIRVALAVETGADDETLDELVAAVEDRCPVSDTLSNGTGLEVTLER